MAHVLVPKPVPTCGRHALGFAPAKTDPQSRSGLKGGFLTTRTIRFSGHHLFVNAAIDGELRVEVLDEAGHSIAPFTPEQCSPVRGDATRTAVSWKGASLESLAGRPVKLRFWLDEARLYAFWISPWPTGESRGATAAGGPEFAGTFDDRPATATSRER